MQSNRKIGERDRRMLCYETDEHGKKSILMGLSTQRRRRDGQTARSVEKRKNDKSVAQVEQVYSVSLPDLSFTGQGHILCVSEIE